MSQKIASLYAEIGANTAGFEAGAKKVKGGLGAIGAELGRVIPPGVIQFASFSGAILAVGDALKTSVDDTLQYANEVRNLSMVAGTSTEESSRFLQVLDDYKISASEAMTATRALTKEGLTPSIETLAKLSDEYLSLSDAQARNELVLKNLGRGGLEWVEILNKGGDAIRAQGAAIDKSLILTQKSVDSAREYEIALDTWNDSVMALKISIGSELLPVMTDMLNAVNDNRRATEIMAENTEQLSIFQKAFTKDGRDAWQTALDQARAEREAATAAMLHSDAMDQASQSAENEAAALKAVSDANMSMLGLIDRINGEYSTYAEDVAAVNADINLSEDERIAKLAELEAEHTRVTNQIVLDLLTQKLTADGILTDDEFNWLIEKGQAWGIYSNEVVQEAKRAMDEANKLAQTIANIPENKTVTITVQTLGGYQQGTAGYEHIAHPGRAAGGPVMAGYPYMVGERGPEMFVPQSNGQIVNNDKLRSQQKPQNVTINISGEFRNWNDLNYLAQEVKRRIAV